MWSRMKREGVEDRREVDPDVGLVFVLEVTVEVWWLDAGLAGDTDEDLIDGVVLEAKDVQLIIGDEWCVV